MARTIKLTSGSIFNGSPITFTIQPDVITGVDSDKKTVYPSFHRIILEVKCGMSGGNFETIKMSAPVEQESDSAKVTIDISSALRTFRDSYEYSPDVTTYPLVKFALKVYDEYMLSGEVHQVGEILYPSEVDGEQSYSCTIFGAFTDMERMKSNAFRDVLAFSRKPSSAPQIVAVGETYAYTPSYATAQSLLGSTALVAPASAETTITKEGLQTVNGLSLFALPQEEAHTRQVFRFINGMSVLESVSVPRVYGKKLAVTSTSYNVIRQETFNKFSRAVVHKTGNRESWLFSTDPLNEDWLHWYLHEFLMSEHIWMQVSGTWIPCTVSVEDDTTFLDRTQQEVHTVSFTAILDCNGSPLL